MVKWPVGSVLERYWAKHDTWYVGTVTKERRVRVGNVQQRQVLIHYLNEKTQRNDAWLSQGCKELREHVDY